jgi:hypothetical protein
MAPDGHFRLWGAFIVCGSGKDSVPGKYCMTAAVEEEFAGIVAAGEWEVPAELYERPALAVDQALLGI